MNKITFSIIVPLYNKENFICRTIDSILKQTYDNFELIIVDDGSTDSSVTRLAKYNDPRLKVHSQNNAGVSAARNKGIELAVNEWVSFLDADDVWLPFHLEELVKIHNEFPSAKMISSNKTEVSNDDVDSYSYSSGKNEIKIINYFLEASQIPSIIWTSSVAVLANVFDDVGGFSDFKRGEDLEMWCRIALKSEVAISKKTTSIYVKQTGGLMDSGYFSSELNFKCTPFELSMVSPSASFLINHLPKIKSPSLKSDVLTYVNSRVLAHIRGNLIRCNIKVAKKLRRYLIKPTGINSKFYSIITLLPAPMLLLLVSTRAYLRDTINYLKSIKKSK